MQLKEKVTEQDIWNYWKTLFPEVKEERKLEELLGYNEPFQKNQLEKFYLKHLDQNTADVEMMLQYEEDDRFTYFSGELVKKNSLYHAFCPVIRQSWEKIEQIICYQESKECVKDVDAVTIQLLEYLCERLLELSLRTLILEIHVMRQKGKLIGSDKYERYRFYTENLWHSEEYILQFYHEYRHLYFLQKECISDFSEFCMEVLSHTWEHCLEIEKNLCRKQGDDQTKEFKIEEIRFGQGDSHKSGKTVTILRLTNGKRVVYKPRSLKMEKGFLQYLSFLNTKLPKEDRLYEIAILDCGSYGFIEYIDTVGCNESEEVKRYYRRAGNLMAMLYSLNAKDLHHENLIACGEQPVIIDLEALFHCKLDYRKVQKDNPAYNISLNRLDDSVYAIGLLPMPLTNPYNKTSENVDVSGFGGEEAQISPFKVYVLQEKDTDEIRLEKSTYEIQPQGNLPKLSGKIAAAVDYQAEICQGFTWTYRCIMENRELIARRIEKWFDGAYGRLIYRPTYIYTKLMFTGTHPDFMRQKVHRYVLFHRLAYQTKNGENLLLKSEIYDMMKNDVPFFEINIASGVIQNSKEENIVYKFEKTPLEIVKNKIIGFSAEDLEQQIEIIGNAFGVRKLKDYQESCMSGSSWQKEKVSKPDYLEIAEKIGNYILEKADKGILEGRPDYCWMNFTPVGEEVINYQYKPVEGDLYSGNSGIALFFLYLAELTQKKKYMDAVHACMNSVIYKMKRIGKESAYLIGPYNGLSGYLYVCSKVYQCTGNIFYLQLVKEGLQLLGQIYARDTNFDMISGSAGALKVLLSIEKTIEEEEIQAICGEEIDLLVQHLYDHAIELENGGIAWKSGLNDHIYVGYAHGSCGIEEALSSVYEQHPGEKIMKMITASGKFVDSQYDKNMENWRSVKGRDGVSNAWCHGAPGILYTRVRQMEVFGDNPELQRDIRRALVSSIKYGLGNHICYCHGDIGNLELIKYAAKAMGDGELVRMCDHTYAKIALSFEEYITTRKILPYGLMLGLSGIGYSLLRQISENVPSILQLK